jgi:hypothetical protein
MFSRGDVAAVCYGRRFFNHHWRSFALLEVHDFIPEIEEFKVCQPLLANGPPYHAFLCSMFLYTFLLQASLADWSPLTECAKQLALVVECPDLCIQSWLEQDLIYSLLTLNQGHIHLQRASDAINVNVSFPAFYSSNCPLIQLLMPL